MLNLFSSTIQEKEVTETLIDAYFLSLKNVNDDTLKKVSYKCLDDFRYFPKIPEVKQKLEEVELSKGNEFLKSKFTCPVCKIPVSLIIEGVCLDCYDHVPLSAGRKKAEPARIMKREANYLIQNRVRCNQCGNMGMGIKEPIDSDGWECRECYTDLSKADFIKKCQELSENIGKAFNDEIPF